jgi:hypothetical protein
MNVMTQALRDFVVSLARRVCEGSSKAPGTCFEIERDPDNYCDTCMALVALRHAGIFDEKSERSHGTLGLAIPGVPESGIGCRLRIPPNDNAPPRLCCLPSARAADHEALGCAVAGSSFTCGGCESLWRKTAPWVWTRQPKEF